MNEQIISARLKCPNCGQYHNDHDEWATRPHRTHLCEHCGNEWEVTVRGLYAADENKLEAIGFLKYAISTWDMPGGAFNTIRNAIALLEKESV